MEVRVIGPRQSAISPADVQQIRRVVGTVPEYRRSVILVRPVGADAAAIQCGSAEVNGPYYHTFMIRRLRGKWTIDPSTEATGARILVY